MPSAPNTSCIEVCRVADDIAATGRDKVAVEEPLEIQIGFERKGIGTIRSISVTMRTPGNDEELAIGFLFGEGLLNRRSEVVQNRTQRRQLCEFGPHPSRSGCASRSQAARAALLHDVELWNLRKGVTGSRAETDAYWSLRKQLFASLSAQLSICCRLG